MKFEDIRLDKLTVNQANDRHGELISEDAAIEWLLTHRANHMRNLAKDVVEAGGLYEPPLIHEENGSYVVYDGNRRTTTLKLLQKPQSAPSKAWAEFYAGQRANWQGKFPTTVLCQIEPDRERLDEILYRRHTGQQSGVGQSQWDAPAKTNFERRTGKNTKLDIAEAVEKLLKENDDLSESAQIPRSNFKRLLSAEQFRNRVGISVDKNTLNFTHDKARVLAALKRIASDLIAKKVTLDEIWDNKAKRKYLNKLDEEGVLPSVEDALPESKPATKKASKTPDKKSPKKSSPPERRVRLIRNIDHGIQPSRANRKALDIFDELQHRLKFGDHDNAIAVLFRVLLEISIDIYIHEKSLTTAHKNDKLASKFRKVLDDLVATGELDKKQASSLKSFEKSEALFSTNTLHAYIHSAEYFPSDHHLKGMWDTLETFVVKCLQPSA